MRHNIYSILLAASAICALPSCDKEAAFSMKPGEGQLNCDALSVDYINRGRNTRAANVEIGDFNVNFVNTATEEVARSFKYSEMPELVALPAGNYRAEAAYGDNPIAEWEDPYLELFLLHSTPSSLQSMMPMLRISAPVTCEN